MTGSTQKWLVIKIFIREGDFAMVTLREHSIRKLVKEAQRGDVAAAEEI